MTPENSRRRFLAATAGTLSAALAGCNTLGVLGSSAPEGVVRWYTQVAGSVQPWLMVAHDRVYAGVHRNEGKQLHSLRREDGTKVWSRGFGASITTSPSLVDGIVFADVDGTMHAVGTNDRGTRWRTSLSARAAAEPVVANGSVFVGSRAHEFFALDVTSGTERWRTKTAEWISGQAVLDGTVYVAAGNLLYALDETDGGVEWTTLLPGGSSSEVVIADAQAIVCAGTSIQAVDLSTAKREWRFDGVHPLYSGLTHDDGTLYATGYDRGLYAVDAATGEERWHFASDSPFRSTPAVDGDLVYAYTETGVLRAFDRVDGTVRWQRSLEADANESTPVVVDGIVYLGDSEGRVYAITGPS